MSHADCSAVQTVARWLVTSQNIRDFAQSRRGLSKRNETPRIVIKMDFLHRLTSQIWRFYRKIPRENRRVCCGNDRLCNSAILGKRTRTAGRAWTCQQRVGHGQEGGHGNPKGYVREPTFLSRQRPNTVYRQSESFETFNQPDVCLVIQPQSSTRKLSDSPKSFLTFVLLLKKKKLTQ